MTTFRIGAYFFVAWYMVACFLSSLQTVNAQQSQADVDADVRARLRGTERAVQDLKEDMKGFDIEKRLTRIETQIDAFRAQAESNRTLLSGLVLGGLLLLAETGIRFIGNFKRTKGS